MRKLRNLFFLIFLILFSKLAFAFPIETIHYTGPKQNRINIVFMSEGYTSAELENFISDVKNISAGFFEVSPYREYKSFFNIYAIKIPSVQSGAAHPHTTNDCPPLSWHPISNPNTYFQSSFDGFGIHRAVYVPDTTQVDNVLMSHIPEYTVPVVLINEPNFSGGTGGFPIVMTNRDDSGRRMAQVFQHEVGHYLGELADEYDYDGGCGGDSPNVTQETSLENIPWKRWISNSIPTTVGPFSCQNVGLFEGANHCSTGWYRPACTCKMKESEKPFCAVCTEMLVAMILHKTKLYDGASPEPYSGVIHVNYGEYKGFAVSGLKTDYSKSNKDFSSTPAAGLGPMCISPNTISYMWELNGVTVGTPTNSYVFKIDHGPYDNDLCVTIYDRTHWLKVNPISDPIYTKVCWTIEINH